MIECYVFIDKGLLLLLMILLLLLCIVYRSKLIKNDPYSPSKITMKRITGVFWNFMRTHNVTSSDPVAVAVSGGCDSLALAVTTQTYFNPNSIHILTVDHRIRAESTSEAQNVKKTLENYDFLTHKILSIKWPFGQLPPNNKLEVRSRDARYELLLTYCQLNKIKILLTAHHHLDRLETCLHRLTMGSSIDGLRGMAQDMSFSTHPGIIAYRPFLEEAKEDLQEVCKEKNLEWVIDPSNFSPLFNRNRLRHVISHNPNLENNLGTVVNFFREFCSEITPQVDDFLQKNSILDPKIGFYYCQWSEFLELPRSIAIRVITRYVNYLSVNKKRNLVAKTSGVTYNNLVHPRNRRAIQKSATDNSVIVALVRDTDTLCFGKSNSYERLQIRVGETVTWDGRFKITLSPKDSLQPTNEVLTIRSMNRSDQMFLFRAIRRIKSAKLPPFHYRFSLPVILRENNQIAFMPHFGYVDFNLNIRCSWELIPHPDSIHTFPLRKPRRKTNVTY